MLFAFHLTDIYSRRSYMGRCSLPISPRRPFVPLPLCASNKHSNQENRLSPARGGCVERPARGREYAPNAPNARIPACVSDEIYPLALYSLYAANPTNATNGKKRGATGTSNKIADQ